MSGFAGNSGLRETNRAACPNDPRGRMTGEGSALGSLTPVIAVAGLCVLLTLGACGCGKKDGSAEGGGKAEASKTQVAPVSVMKAKRGSIQEELELTGTCEAFDEIDVVPEMGGKVIRVYVDVGDAVRAGDSLVQLDTALVAKQRVQAERGVDSAVAHLSQAVEGAELTDRQTLINIRQAEQGVTAALEQVKKAEAAYKLTQDRAAGEIEKAKVGVASAEARRRDALAGARSQELTQAEASVRQAEADLSLKKSNYGRYKRLCDQGAIPEATLDTFRTQYDVAQQSVTQAREALSLAREGTRLEQKRLAELGVAEAEEELRLAEAGRRQVEIAARDIASARVGVRQAEENLRLSHAARRQYNVSVAGVKAARAGVGQAVAGRDLARTTERKYTIFAPISGLVSARDVDVGEGAAPGMRVMRLVNSNPIRVYAQISELDIAKVSVGAQGITTIDGIPGTEFEGLVADVAPQALPNQRNYIARVEIDNRDGIIKAGMFARVRLVVSEKHDVLVINRDCLLERGEERKAYVVRNGTVAIRKVKTGITNGRQVEVISGVRAGELLVSAGQAMLADGQKVKAVAAGSALSTKKQGKAEKPAGG